MNTKIALTIGAVLGVMLLGASAQALADWEEPFLQTINSSDSLRVVQESFDSVRVVLWAVRAASVVLSTFLLFFTARRLHQDDYQGALWSFVAAMVAGASPFFAEALLFT